MSPTVEGIRLGTVGKEINLRRILSEVRQLGKELNLLKERFCDGEFGRRFSHHLATRRLASSGRSDFPTSQGANEKLNLAPDGSRDKARLSMVNSILTESDYVFFRV